MSGYIVASTDQTCYGLSFGSGSGSFTPLKLNSLVTTPLCMWFHLLLLLASPSDCARRTPKPRAECIRTMSWSRPAEAPVAVPAPSQC
jgi:hypothetical protein